MAWHPNPGGSLMGRMAAQAGADIAAALEEGRLAPAEVAAARRRCAACLWPAECAAWLDGQTGRALPPAFCGNGSFIGSLAGVRA